MDFEFAARDMPEDFHRLFIVDVRLVDSWIAGREDDGRLLRDGGYVNMRRGGRLEQESENWHKCRVDDSLHAMSTRGLGLLQLLGRQFPWRVRFDRSCWRRTKGDCLVRGDSEDLGGECRRERDTGRESLRSFKYV